jgi:hypothetical protein
MAAVRQMFMNLPWTISAAAALKNVHDAKHSMALCPVKASAGKQLQ